MDDLQDAIHRAHEKIMRAFVHGDATAMASLYTDNARLFPPDNEMIIGSEAIQSFWQGAMNKGIKEAKLETLELEQRQDMACEVGKFTLTILSKRGRSLTESGKYVVIWKNEEGTWKLHVDIWNK